jgi:hypothetical protein
MTRRTQLFCWCMLCAIIALGGALPLGPWILASYWDRIGPQVYRLWVLRMAKHRPRRIHGMIIALPLQFQRLPDGRIMQIRGCAWWSGGACA